MVSLARICLRCALESRTTKSALTLIALLGTAVAACDDSSASTSTPNTTSPAPTTPGMLPGATAGAAAPGLPGATPAAPSGVNPPANPQPGATPVPGATPPAGQPMNPSTTPTPTPTPGAPAAPMAGGPETPSTCPSEYTTATQVVMNVSWPDSLALVAGTGKVYVWTKSNFTKTGDTQALSTVSCGTLLPALQTSAIAGGMKILPEIPDVAWDNAMMPKFNGTATQAAGMMNIDPGVALIGLQMADPRAAFPAPAEIMALDHDGDGSPGITAVPRTSDGFAAPPTSILQTARTDKLYLATRNILTLSAAVEGCPQTFSGAAQVTNFDTHVIGCHILDGAECAPADATFVDDNLPIFAVASATFTSTVVAATATCAEIRTSMPAL